jgi:hypothetical protein
MTLLSNAAKAQARATSCARIPGEKTKSVHRQAQLISKGTVLG